jgi:hypothetical protein
MKHKKLQLRPIRVQEGTFVPEGQPPSSEDELIAIVAGITTSLLIILSNLARLDKPALSYPITEEEREMLHRLAKEHTESLIHVIQDKGYGDKFALHGANRWNINCDTENGVMESFSATEFEAFSLDFETDD